MAPDPHTIAHHAALDARLVAAVRGIRLLQAVSWPQHVQQDFLAAWRAGRSVLPQVRFGLTKGGHVALNLGVEAPLSDQDWDYRIHAVLLWDFADGSFFKGW